MSIKKYFEVAENIQSLAAKTSKDISGEVESEGYHEQDIIKEERYIPYTDFKKPENFARWGSAEEYYESAIKRIYGTYPYDGSLKERIQWENESTYLDLYLLEERYPRTNGYIILSADSAAVSQVNDGYGRPSTPEYIFLRGGPNPTTGPSTTLAGQFTGSNYYEPTMNRASNLQYDLSSKGVSLEFWLKKPEFLDPSVTSREVIFDMWNGQNSSSADYGRLRLELSASGDSVEGANPLLLTALSGTTGFYRQPIAASTFTTASIADGNWHHYAVTMKSASAGVTTKFYVDGQLNNTTTLGTVGINDVDTPGIRAHIGALVDQVSGSWTTPSPTAAGDGKLSGSLDEFRYWKTQRTSKDIGRYWFTQVGGGVNTDPKPYITTEEIANTNLGVYFKFNEGITGITSIDSTVLDYSGRYSNGTWTGYSANSRNTGSAIVSSSAATHEFLDPIIYDSHPKVKALKTELQLSGSNHDVNNNAAIYNSIPAWIAEEDTEGTKNVKYLTQILGSYFDSLHLQIDNLNTLGSKRYVSGSFEKPIPFAEKLVSSTGMVAPNLFLDADLLEKLADRSEDRVYAMSLHDIKNTIYQNIYNNISYIYKSKGTEKAFRNLIRCFGIDDELIKSNMYASNVEYELRNNRRNTVVADRFVNFNTEDNQVATVFNYADSSNTNSVGFITSSTNLTGGFATTLETEIMFPLKPSEDQAQGYFNTNVISSSLFGMHGAMPQNANNTSWRTNLEAVNFQVYAVRDELLSDNVKFVLTSSGDGHIPVISSSLYQDVYNNKRWNLAVRIRPDQYPVKGIADGANSNYVVELHGVQSEAGEIMEQFTVSGSISSVGLPAAFMTGSRRAYVGAHRTNMTGNVLQTSDVKINACRYWLDYVDDEALAGHILDTENHGAMQPHLYAFPFQTSASFGDVKKIDTLLFNWEFLNNTGSNASGYLTVADISSGSTPKTGFDTGFSIDNLLNQQHTAQGRFFKASSTTAIDKDFVVAAKLNLPENVQSEDMVKVLNAQEQDVFTSDSRPTNYFFAFEKSMYQVISEEMINYFANLKDFNNLIGDQVERYRPDYKQMAFMRQKFFEQVGNDSLDFDKFYEFYKWFDSSLSLMLGQLVPASADFSDNVRTVIENHVLERPKYQQKFPFLQRKGGTDITSSFDGDMVADSSMLSSPEEFAQGTAFFANTAMTKRQIGSSNTSQNRPWKHFHAPVSSTPKGAPPETEKMYWHRYLEERTDATRQDLLTSINNTFDRRGNTPVKLAVEGYTVIGGVGRHANFDPNYVFNVVRPWGHRDDVSGAPEYLLTLTGGIEKLLGTTDEYYPTFKQRLGFEMSVWDGRDAAGRKDDGRNGSQYTPFSLYSSSVTTGYNAEIVANLTSNVDITNLHHDFVQNNDIPMQGPFTEKYVGGRFYRHTEINKGPELDSANNRAEGFQLRLSDARTGVGSNVQAGSLAILPPTSKLGWIEPSNASLWRGPPPTGQRMRGVAAKRPVNIKNIRMTTGSVNAYMDRTGSTVIGNFQKNYQVINTGGRTLNDPFFQDQSFNFALNPENDAPRTLLLDRRPVQNQRVVNRHSKTLADTDAGAPTYLSFLTDASTMGYGDGEAYLMWLKIPDLSTTQRLFNQSSTGRITVIGGKVQVWWFKTGGGTNGVWIMDDANVPENEWFQLIVSYKHTTSAGMVASPPEVYINGVGQSMTVSSTPAGSRGTWGGTALIGFSSNLGLNGTISEFALFSEYLTPAAVRTLYRNAPVDLRQELPQLFGDHASNHARLLPNWYLMGDGKGDTNNTFVNQGLLYNLTSTGSGGTSALVSVAAGDCERYLDDFALPDRTGTNSNQTIIVNHFSSPGGYKTLSRGFLDPAHEELSVYNAYPYRNRDVIDYGLSGSASVDPTLYNRMRVQDQLNKPRGLNQRATLRSGQYGTDAAYGAINLRNTRVDGGLGYSETPSWHKTNRNRLRRMDNLAPDATPGDYPAANNYTASVFDNLFVQHAIPRSEAQYAWITGSMIAGKHIFGLDKPSCFSASTLSQLLTASRGSTAFGTAVAGGSSYAFGLEAYDNAGVNEYIPVDFAGLNTIILEPVSASSHIQGQPRMRSTPQAVVQGWNNYLNQSNNVAGEPYAANHQGFLQNNPMVHLISSGYPGSAGVFNALMLNRNGPYGYPTWKQIRAGESKVARHLRKNSLIGTVVPPSKIADTVGGIQVGYIQPTQPNSFVDFYESPIESSNNPIYFYFEDNTEGSDPANNIVLTVPYGNRFEYFSNPGLNNYLGLQIDMNKETAYDSVVDFAVSSSLSLKVEYSQRIYPSMVNAYNNIIRSRTTFTIANIWSPNRLRRSGDGAVDVGFGGFAYGASPFRFSGSQGQLIASSSIWPLDGPRPERLFLSDGSSNPNRAYLTSSVTASDGAGELMNFYSRYANRNTGSAGNLPRPFINMLTQSFAAPTYASRVPAGCAGNDTIVGNMVLAGGTPWIAPSQANKDPYENYTDYSDQIRAAAKDYSIVPEYRVSPLMDLYVNRSAGDFLSTAAEFDLTGATYVNSSVDKFYRTYSNADFLKYFKHVDEDLNDQRSGDLKIRKDKISLNCEAFVKFLPYKGFYPAERTLELATILSKSFGSQLAYNPDLVHPTISLTARYYANQRAAYRIFLEPLMSPGILFNTIKSGIACSNFVLTEGSSQTSWLGAQSKLLPTASQTSPETHYPETQGSNGLYYGLNPSVTNYVAGPVRPPWAGASGSAARILSLGSSSSGSYDDYENDSNNFMLRKMPFEAIYRPTQYFNANFIGGDGREIVSIYDTAASGTSAWIPTWNYYTVSGYTYGYAWQSSILMGMPSSYRTSGLIDASPELGGGEDYTLAIDNFLCESMNMFVDGGASLVSARQENFQDQVEGRIYTGVVKLFRTLSGSQGTTEPFEMYSRASAFGIPLDANTRKTAKYGAGGHETGTQGISFSHVTPPYFAGESYVTLTYTASYSGRPDLDDIFAQLTSSYYRDEYVPNLNAASAVERGTNEDIRMQIKDSVNLFTKIQEVPEGTNDQKARWLIQPKFETPILNFAGVSTGSAMVPSYTRTAATASANQITTRGMWHQYGSVISSSNAGVFLSCQDKLYDQPTTDGINFSLRRHSLWDLVGMPTGKNERIGNPKNEFLLEEAVVAVPFRTTDSGEREFIKFPTSSRASKVVDYKKTNTYRRLNVLLDKYVFPPIFDFKRFDTVDPIMMYAFEFSAKLNQKDITDIWQNLPPSVAERFEVQNAVVEERELIDAIVSRTRDIEWMVFKVKKRAKKDFEKFRRSLVSEADISAFPDQITSKMTYNWPYDYCSLVELAKIEEMVTYTSADVRSPQMNPEIEAVEAPVPATTRTATTRTTRAPTKQASKAGVATRRANSAKKAAAAKTKKAQKKATKKRTTKTTKKAATLKLKKATKKRGGRK